MITQDRYDNSIKQALSVAYDQTHDHQCLTNYGIVSQALKSKQSLKNHQIKQERKKQHTLSLSLEAYDLYIFSPFGNKLPKSS